MDARRIAAALLLIGIAAAMRPAPVRGAGDGLPAIEVGSGPTLVFVPGLGYSRADWLPVVKSLKDRYHCVVIDLPGQGASPSPVPFSLAAAAAMLDDVVARSPADSTIVVGHGFGGNLAVLMAKAHPEHLRGLVLLNTQVREMSSGRYHLLESALPESLSVQDSLEIVRSLRRLDLVPAAVVHDYYAATTVIDFTPTLARLGCPVRALFAAEPGLVSAMGAGRFARVMGWEDTTRFAAAWVPGGEACTKNPSDSLSTAIDRFALRVLAAPR